MAQFNFTLSDLKKQLGDGLGIRSNLYGLVVPLPYEGSYKLAVLAKSTSLPERTIGTTDIYHMGRRYKIRGETDLQGTYTINMTDDSNMKLRQFFDSWMKSVDNTTPEFAGIVGELFEGQWADALNVISGTLQGIGQVARDIRSSGDTWAQRIKNYSVSSLKSQISGNQILAPYQVDVEVYQLSVNNKEAIYGYKLQNCFPIEVGAVEISDESENQLSEFSVQLAYSDFEPILPSRSTIDQVIEDVLGDSAANLKNSWKIIKESFN